jgi:hypothetical protein
MDAREHEDTPADKPLLLLLVKRTDIFLLIICVISLFYWVVGSVSFFQDETQSMLMYIARVSSQGMIVASAFGILLSLAFAIARGRGLKIIGILGYILVAAIGAVALALAQSISILAQGLR